MGIDSGGPGAGNGTIRDTISTAATASACCNGSCLGLLIAAVLPGAGAVRAFDGNVVAVGEDLAVTTAAHNLPVVVGVSAVLGGRGDVGVEGVTRSRIFVVDAFGGNDVAVGEDLAVTTAAHDLCGRWCLRRAWQPW